MKITYESFMEVATDYITQAQRRPYWEPMHLTGAENFALWLDEMGYVCKRKKRDNKRTDKKVKQLFDKKADDKAKAIAKSMMQPARPLEVIMAEIKADK